jgi:hypothetical protein
MSINKQELIASASAVYFDNANQLITPLSIRQLNDTWITSSVMQKDFNEYTGSASSKFAGTAATASFLSGSVGTASFALTASVAASSSYFSGSTAIVDNITINGTASIQYLNVTYKSASVIYSSGSNQFGDSTSDTQTLIGTVVVSGSLQVTGSVNADITGTASFSVTSSHAITASYVESSSYSVSSSLSQTASYALSSSVAVSSSYALTASYLSGSIDSASFATTASYALTASYLSGSVNAFPFTGSADVTGSINSFGNLSVKEGYLVLENLPEYGDEASAAAGGVPLNGIFRNGNFIVIRLV